MTVRFQTIAAAGLATLLVGGCSIDLLGRSQPRHQTPPPLTAAPSGTVTGTTLPPPSTGPTAESPGGLAALDPNAGAADPNATAPASAGGTELARTDLLGGWTIAAAGDSCQLFMTLTTWAGGYRASTRDCATSLFQGISAWNIESGQVQLLNDAGTTVARLYPASKTQLNGQTSGGGPVTVTR